MKFADIIDNDVVCAAKEAELEGHGRTWLYEFEHKVFYPEKIVEEELPDWLVSGNTPVKTPT